MASSINSVKSKSALLTFLKEQARSFLPTKTDFKNSIILFLMVLFGAILLYPLFVRLPLLGWDWYFFFNSYHPTDNINHPFSPFFPYTKIFVSLLTWLPWRDSLAILGGITYMSIALGAWKNGGKYASVLLAVTTPVSLFDLWVGHPDGLALLGFLMGFIPLAFVQPQITLWSYLRSKAWIFWAGITLAFVFILKPTWIHTLTGGAVWGHSASFGWHALGWPVLLLGILLTAGAGSNPWLLMSGGCMLSPDLMPYHLVVFLPAIGKVAGWKKILVWLAAWVVALGTGLGGPWRWLNLLLPLTIYFSLQTPRNYLDTIKNYLDFGKQLIKRIFPTGK